MKPLIKTGGNKVAAGALERLNSSIDNSPTRRGTAAASIPGPAHKAVMFDADGNIAIATSGEVAVGVILSATVDPVVEGRDVHYLIKHIGLVEAGAPIAMGALVTVNGSGQVIPAASGDFIFGRAFDVATAAGQVIHVQINQMGYMA